MEQIKNNNLIIFGAILGASIIIASIIASAVFYNVRLLFDNALSVTGSAKQTITADIVKWTSGFSRTVSIDLLSYGYSQIAVDQEAVMKFLKDNGVKEDEITISPVSLEEPFKYDSNAPKQYTLRQTVQVNSNEVDKITDLAKNAKQLASKGIVFSTFSLEYYYSKLPDLRVSLLSEAVKDAKARAEKIAESTGRKVGTLKSASMGVVQVLPINSTEVSDWGSYDTSGIEKEVMVTVKTMFVLK